MGSMRFNTGTFTFHRNSDQRTAGHQTFTMRFYHSSWTHSYQTSAVATATVKDIDAVADPGFLMRGSPTLGCANLLFGKSFDENCMKMKRITERRELPPPPPPPGSANGQSEKFVLSMTQPGELATSYSGNVFHESLAGARTGSTIG